MSCSSGSKPPRPAKLSKLTPKTAALAAVFLSACVRFNLGGIPVPGESESPEVTVTPTVTPPPVTGGFSGGDLRPTQTQAPSTTPSAATPSPTATQPDLKPRAVELTVTPKTATLNVFARLTATPLYPTSVQLTAEVLLSSGQSDSKAKWRSLRPETATVDGNGLVTAGSATGDAIIVATSLDGEASATAKITLTDFGAAEVVVD